MSKIEVDDMLSTDGRGCGNEMLETLLSTCYVKTSVVAPLQAKITKYCPFDDALASPWVDQASDVYYIYPLESV